MKPGPVKDDSVQIIVCRQILQQTYVFSLSRRLGSTIASSLSVLMIAAIGFDAAVSKAGGDQAPSVEAWIKVMVVGFPMIAAIGSFSCFTFIWNINKDVRAKMAEWKAARAG